MKPDRREKGSVSIEAAISLVAFTIFMVCVLSMINISRAQMQLQVAVDKAAKELSGYLYLYQVSGLYGLDQGIQSAGDKTRDAFNTATGSLDNIFAGVEKINDQINNVESVQDRESLAAYVGPLVESIQNGATTLSQESETLKRQFEQISDDPLSYVKSLGAILVSEGADELKSYVVGSLMARSLTVKYLGGREEADARLKSWNVLDGVDGLDFSCSTVFNQQETSANGAEDVNILLLYRMKLTPLLGSSFQQTFAVSASTRAWLGGDTQIDRMKSPNP